MSYFYFPNVGQLAIYVARWRFAPDFGILGHIRFDGVLSDTANISTSSKCNLQWWGVRTLINRWEQQCKNI